LLCEWFGRRRERVCGQGFGLLGAGGDESFQCFGGGWVEREISQALVAGFDLGDACGEKVCEAEGAAGEVNRGGGGAGRGGAPGGLVEEL